MSFFDDYVDFFDEVQATSWYKELLKQFVGFLEVNADMSVLDIGCGPGYLTRYLSGMVKFVSCVDISEAMVKKAREHVAEEGIENVSYTVGKAEFLPDKNDYFDIVTATSVIYFLDSPERALREMTRVIKKGGLIAMLNPAIDMTEENVAALIEKHGLTGFEAESLEDWQYAAENARRFSENNISELLIGAGLSQIRHERHLENMVLFSKATKR